MGINFPLIDPNRTQFNKGIGTEIGTPIAQAIQMAAQRRKEERGRQAMKAFLDTGQWSEEMPSDVLEKVVAEKAKPKDLSFGDMLTAQKYREEQEGGQAESASAAALTGVVNVPDRTLKMSGIEPTLAGRSGLAQRFASQYSQALGADREGRGLPVNPKVTQAPFEALKNVLTPMQTAEREERLASQAPANIFIGTDAQGRPLIMPSRGEPTLRTTDVPGGGPVLPRDRPGAPLPQNAQENLTGALDAWRALNILEAGVSESGIGTGMLSKGQAALGFNEKAVNFEAARNQFKLSAQSMIKGIPSNFDVQTLINTIPALPEAQATNKARIANARASIRMLAQNTVAYYKGVGYQIPPEVDQLIRAFGIDAQSVTPWNGLGDPLQPNAKIPSDRPSSSGGSSDLRQKYGLE